MKQSVVVCTRDRAASLARLLDSLARCEPPRHASWQVVVVDNGSRDGTPAVLESFRERLPLVALREPQPGLSRARNAGLDAADGDYLLWTDDDVALSRGWLRAYEAAFEAHPDAAFFGGPIRPRFEGSPPRWLPPMLPELRTAFAALEQPDPRGRLDRRSPHLPYGANLVVRGAEQRCFRFDLRRGRQPGPILFSGEESDVLRRIARAGGTGVWVPDAEVEHWIDPARQTRAYLRRYYAGDGYLGTRDSLDAGRATGLGARLRLRRRIALRYGAYLGGRLLGSPQRWVPALRDTAVLRGRLIAHQEATRRASRPHAARATRTTEEETT
jgi:glycosyltransferase involved in cell wall biosynthesis